jgi:hypothetical protein
MHRSLPGHLRAWRVNAADRRIRRAEALKAQAMKLRTSSTTDSATTTSSVPMEP